MTYYSACFHEKFILKKLIIFVKLKKQNIVRAHEFSWFAMKVVCTTYNLLGISALISGPCEMVYFFALFHDKNYTKRMDNFDKIKETKCHMCT